MIAVVNGVGIVKIAASPVRGSHLLSIKAIHSLRARPSGILNPRSVSDGEETVSGSMVVVLAHVPRIV
jgi:hypothetical protein